MSSRRPAAPALRACLALALAMPASLGAQRRAESDRGAMTAQNAVSVRAELASVLLQSKKYDDAAREFRALVARDTGNVEYRLGLARALAWGGRNREAERELHALQAKKVRIGTIDTLLRAAREAMEPRQWEAAAWVAERGDYAPYRLSYARALVRERFYWLAVVQYDTLLAGASLGPIPDASVLRREQAYAYLDAGALDAAAARLREVLRLTPADTGVRHVLAVALADGSRRTEARAQYDTLLAAAPTAGLFSERARLRLVMLDTNGAQSDLMTVVSLDNSASALILLGDIYRQREQYTLARAMYGSALATTHDSRGKRMAIRRAIAGVAREERPVAAFAPALGDDPGWRVSTGGIGDNLGVHYAASTVSGTVALGASTRASVGMMHHYLGERSPSRTIDLSIVGAEASLASEAGYGPVLGRFAVSGGGLRIPQSRSIPLGSATLAAWLNAWELAANASTGPAYSSLLTTTALRPDSTASGDPLTEQSATVMLGGPVRAMDVAVTAQQSRLSDGNQRTTVQGYLRVPLTTGVSVVYAGSHVAFARRSLRYWDPFEYDAHALGLEVASRSQFGLSFAARVLPGGAWSTEPQPPQIRVSRNARRLPEKIERSAFQLTTSGELSWRAPRWEGTAAMSYGQGRAGEYRRLGLTLGARVLP